MTDNSKQYIGHDIEALDDAGNYYSRHVNAMTAENLFSKSDIAAELGYRDKRIDELLAALEEKDQRIAELERGQQKPAGYIDARCFEGKYPTGGSWSLQPHDIGGLNQLTPFYLSPAADVQRLQQPIPESLIAGVCMIASDIYYENDEDKAQDIINRIRDELLGFKVEGE